MRKFILIVVMGLLANIAFGGFWAWDTALAPSFKVSNDVSYNTGALDPTATAVEAVKGSQYLSTTTGKLYVKQDAGSSTNWLELASSASIPVRNYSEWNASMLYAQGDKVSYNGFLFTADAAIPTLGTFVESEWTRDTAHKEPERLYGSCLLEGGALTRVDDDTFNIAAGSGIVNDPNDADYKYRKVSWSSQDIDLTAGELTDIATPIYIEAPASVPIGTIGTGTVFKGSANDPVERRSKIFIGLVVSPNGAIVDNYAQRPVVCGDEIHATDDIFREIGFIKQGMILKGVSATLNVSMDAGLAISKNINYENDPTDPHRLSVLAVNPIANVVKFYRDGSGGWTFLPAGGFDFSSWDDGSGTLDALPNNNTAAHLLFYSPRTRVFYQQYGQFEYNNLNQARERFTSDVPELYQVIADDAMFLGYLLVESNASDITDEDQARLISSGKFASFGGTGTGGGSSDLTNYVQTAETPDADIVNKVVTWASDTLKSIKRTTVEIVSDFVRASGFIGDWTEPNNVVVQDGTNYNATDSSLVGGATVAVTEVAEQLDIAELTMSGTTAGSLMAFDQMTDVHLIKDHFYKVRMKYGISGTTDDLIECAVYDNDVLVANQTPIKLPATNNQTKLAGWLFKMPTSPTKIQVKCEQLVTSTETFTVSKLWYDASELATMTLAKDSEYVMSYGYASKNGSQWAKYNNEDSQSDYGDLISVTNTDHTRYTFNKIVDFEASASSTQETSKTLEFEWYTKDDVLRYQSTSTTPDTRNSAAAPLVGRANIGDYLVVRYEGTGANDTTNFFSITATPIASSTGIAASGEIDPRNYQYPSYDETEVSITGTNWTTDRANFIPYETSNGTYRMKFNIHGDLTSSATSLSLTINGITTAPAAQAVLLTLASSSRAGDAFILDSSNVIFSNITTGPDRSEFTYSGDIELSSWPTWATKKNSFSGTMVAPVAVEKILRSDLTGYASLSGDIIQFANSSASDSDYLEVSVNKDRITFLKDIKNVTINGTFQLSSGVGFKRLYLKNSSGTILKESTSYDEGSSTHNTTHLITSDVSTGDYVEMQRSAGTPVNDTTVTYLSVQAKVLETGTVATTTDVIYRYSAREGTPTSSTMPCSAGTVLVDNSYIYVCRQENSWVRSAASSW